MATSEQIGEIAMILLTFRDQLKIYHWMTTNYARHKATDILVVSLTAQMDRFMETLQGSKNKRLKLSSKNKIIKFENPSDSSILDVLVAFKNWLTNILPTYLKPFDKDLSNIRDEILGSVNHAIYLFTLH